MLLMTVVPPETKPGELCDDCMNEYEPTTSEMPPPYTFAPKQRVTDFMLLDIKDDDAVQEFSVLLDIV